MPYDSDEVRKVSEVAPQGSIVFIAEDGNVEYTDFQDQIEDEIADVIAGTDTKYVIRVDQEDGKAFEMEIDDRNKIKNIDQYDFDQVIRNA